MKERYTEQAKKFGYTLVNHKAAQVNVTQKIVVVTWDFANFKSTVSSDLVTICNPKWLD